MIGFQKQEKYLRLLCYLTGELDISRVSNLPLLVTSLWMHKNKS